MKMSGNLDRDVAEVKKYLVSQYMNTVDEWLKGFKIVNVLPDIMWKHHLLNGCVELQTSCWPHFQNLHCKINTLNSCVEYLYDDGSGKQYSIDEIKMLTRGQWLLNDLTVICPGCLPPSLNQTARTVLNGQFVLQINCLMDIGCPAYQQLQKLKNINEENIEATVHREDKIASHRMVKMDLTDGVQDITAIEYRPMRNLTCELPPGTKILIKGPVDCSIGTLLLEEKNVEVLGGEVDSLVENNSTLQILNRMVYGQSERPKSDYSVQSGPPNVINSRQNFVREVPQNNINCNTQINTTSANIYNQKTNARPSENFPTIDLGQMELDADNFQEDDMNIDIDQLAAIEQQALAVSPKQNPKQAKHAIQLQSQDFYENISNAHKRMKIDANSSVHNMKHKNINYYTVDEIDLTTNNDLAAQLLAEMDAKLAQSTSNIPITLCDSRVAMYGNVNGTVKAIFPIKVAGEPFCYIKQINSIIKNNQGKGRKFIIKAQIQKVLSKLLIIKECWTLRCTLIDGSGKLDADFTSDTLTKLVGYSPIDMGKMKKQFQANPDLKLKATEALKSAKEKLQILNCLVEITIMDTPKITQLIEYTYEHLLLLKQRSTENS